MVLDVDLLVTGILAFAFVFLTFLSIAIDEVRLFIIAGIIAFLVAFQIWTVTSNMPATLSMVVLGITLMALTVAKQYEVL